MGAEEMAHANWRLDNPPVVDVAVSRRMGLFVVARLAARHGIRVRLRPAAVRRPDRPGLAARRVRDARRRHPPPRPGRGRGPRRRDVRVLLVRLRDRQPGPGRLRRRGVQHRRVGRGRPVAGRGSRHRGPHAPVHAAARGRGRRRERQRSAVPYRARARGEPARPAFGGGHASPSGIPPEQVPASAQESYSARQDLFAPVSHPTRPPASRPASPVAFTNGDVPAPSGPQSVFGAPPAAGASGVQDRPVSTGNGLGARGWTPGSSAAGAASTGQGGNGGVVVPPPASPRRGAPAAHLRGCGVRLVPPRAARGVARPVRDGAGGRAHQHLDLARRRRLACGPGGQRADLRRADLSRPAQAGAQGEPGPRRGRIWRPGPRRPAARAVGRCHQGTLCQFPAWRQGRPRRPARPGCPGWSRRR